MSYNMKLRGNSYNKNFINASIWYRTILETEINFNKEIEYEIC